MIKIPRSYKLPLVIILLELVGIWILFTLPNSKNEPLFFYYKGIPIIKEASDPKKDKIEKIIQNYTNKIPGDYALYIKDLKRSNTYTFEEKKVFKSASLYKLAILYKVYEETENGNLDKNLLLSADKLTLDQKLAADGSDEKESNQPLDGSENKVVSYTVEVATKLMIRISDNYSALLLVDKVGWGNAQKSLEKINILGFDLTSESASRVDAYSVGQLLEKIYKKEAISKQASAEMIDILADQRINDRIPKLLPRDIKVAHKTGELDKARHDVGIVFGKNGDYIFVFLSETADPLQAGNNLALASKEIFDILEN